MAMALSPVPEIKKKTLHIDEFDPTDMLNDNKGAVDKSLGIDSILENAIDNDHANQEDNHYMDFHNSRHNRNQYSND